MRDDVRPDMACAVSGGGCDSANRDLPLQARAAQQTWTEANRVLPTGTGALVRRWSESLGWSEQCAPWTPSIDEMERRKGNWGAKGEGRRKSVEVKIASRVSNDYARGCRSAFSREVWALGQG